MNFPESSILKATLVWLILAAINALVWSSFVAGSASEAVGAFLIRLLLPSFSGGLAAGFMPVKVLAWLSAMTFASTLVLERLQSLKWSAGAFSSFMLLSLLTLWLDTFLVAAFSPLLSSETVEATASVAASQIVGLLKLPIGAAVTAAWIFVWIFVLRELEAERGTASRTDQYRREVEAMLQDAFTMEDPSETVIAAVSDVDRHCNVCQIKLPAANRFCTRCGAPVNGLPTKSRENS